MKNKNVILSLTCLLALTLTGCNKSSNPFDTGEITYDGINLHYNSSDKDMNTFLNDFTHRNMRYDSDSCGEYPVAHGTGFAKNWEAMAVAFQNSSKQVYREDKFEMIANYLIQITQDDQGLIDNTPLVNEDEYSEAGDDLSGYSVPQGWPFPSWQNSVDNYLDMGNLEAVHTTEFNFNDAGHPQSQDWHSENGEFHFEDLSGYGHFSTDGDKSSSNPFSFYRDNLSTLLPYSGGVDTKYAPIIDMEIEYNATNIKDYNIIFKVEGDSTWHVAPQSVYASDPTKYVNGYVHARQFFDMYLHPDWNHKIVTELGVQFVGQDGKNFNVSQGRINFIRPTYDTRQSNATYQFILAVGSYFSFTRDYKTLLKVINKARKGILFLTHALEGEKGLLSLEYLYGHDGVVPYCIEGKETDRLSYHSIGNGYSDLTVSPMICLEANVYFYQALKTMAMLEDAMKDVENDNPTSLSVKNRLPYGERVYYNYTSESLRTLAATVKANIEKPIQPQKVDDYDNTYGAGDYNYRNVGGLWNPNTGRFCLGINEYNGKVLDFGHVYLNLEAVVAGVGTDAQQLEIMKWIDGQRTVAGDRSTGKDIYFYEFAPRFNTRDCEEDGGCYGFIQDENFYYRIWYYGYDTWSRQVQNGGAVVAWSYYDLVARARVLGVSNALKRLDEIKKWYLKILDYGGNGLAFYDDYYDDLDYELTLENPDMYMVYSIQASGIRGGGAMGLDAEFIENIIFIRSIPDVLFGMDATDNNNLTFTYAKDNKHSFFEIYNMKYGDAIYSIRSKKNAIEVFNISGIVDAKYTLTFKYKTNKTNITVKVNGEKYNDVKMEGGYAIVTIPFDNAKVIFG